MPARQVAFLRAVNVAGHAVVKKDDLKRAFSDAGCRNVATYIQSGNVIFDEPAGERRVLRAEIQANLNTLLGGTATIIYRSLSHLRQLLQSNPFEAVDPASDVKLYVAFLAKAPSRRPVYPLLEPKEELRAVASEKDDVYIVSGRKNNGFYGFPNKFIEKELGVLATSRNWNTIARIVEKFK